MSAELSSLGIAQIVESVIADYDLRDEDGNELTDDLYVIRSEQLGRRPHLHAALRQFGRGGGHHTAQPDRTHGHQETDQRVFEGGEEP